MASCLECFRKGLRAGSKYGRAKERLSRRGRKPKARPRGRPKKKRPRGRPRRS